MANHVNSQLHFIRMNAKAKEKLAMILKWNEMQSGNGSLENFHEIMEHAPAEPNYAWYHDHIGPKWCYFEDYDLDRLHCVSAWGWPDQGYTWLINELRKEDPYLLAQCTYEDEGPNFYGTAGWGPRGFEDYYMDMDEGVDCWKKLTKEFEWMQPYLEEDEDGERSDEFYENMWEAIGQHQDIMWDWDCRGDVELYDEDLMDEAKYLEDGTPENKELKPTWQEQ
jgi:hypothetical protein